MRDEVVFSYVYKLIEKVKSNKLNDPDLIMRIMRLL